MKTSLGSVAVGTVLPVMENGKTVNYVVAKHNYQQDPNGAGHTLLVRTSVLAQRHWDKSNYSLPERPEWEKDSGLPEYLAGYFQNALDAVTLAQVKPLKVKYEYGSGSVETVKTAQRFFVPSRGDLSDLYKDGDLFALGARTVLSNAGLGEFWTRSATYETEKKEDETETEHGMAYYRRSDFSSFYTDDGSHNKGVLPCFALQDTAGVGEDGVLRGNRAPVVNSYYFGMETTHAKWMAFRVPYSVHDEDGDEMLVTELLDGETVRSYTPVDGQTVYFAVTDEMLDGLDKDADHILTVRVTDGADTSEKTYRFRRSEGYGYIVYIGAITGNADGTGYYWTERHVLHNAADENAPITLEPEVTLEKNDLGSFTFTIPVSNPYCDKIKPKATVISVEEDGNEVFMGYVTEMNKDFNLDIEVTCEGELGYLQDRECVIENRVYTIEELVKLALTPDSAFGKGFAEEGKSFNLGTVNVTKPDTDKDEKESKSITDCWSLLSSNLAGSYGGYLRLRKEIKIEDGRQVYRRYLDYLTDIPDRTDQIIQFGVNLLDLSYYWKTNTIVNSVIVMGYATSGFFLWTNTYPIRVEVRNQASIDLYGLCQRIITVDGTKSDNAYLKKKGEEELKKYNPEQLNGTVTINAADLVDIGVDVERLSFLKNARIISEAHGLKHWITCTKEVIPLDAPEEKEFTFGDTASLTAMQAANFGTAGKAWKAIQSTIKYMNSGG